MAHSSGWMLVTSLPMGLQRSLVVGAPIHGSGTSSAGSRSCRRPWWQPTLAPMAKAAPQPWPVPNQPFETRGIRTSRPTVCANRLSVGAWEAQFLPTRRAQAGLLPTGLDNLAGGPPKTMQANGATSEVIMAKPALSNYESSEPGIWPDDVARVPYWALLQKSPGCRSGGVW